MSVTTHATEDTLEVVVDRPGALNAVDDSVMEGLEDALDQAEASSTLKLFVLRGAGERSFISGGDLKAFSSLETEGEGRAMAARMLAILRRIEGLDCWTLAAVNGPAYGGGCETSLAFDLRLVAAHATFGFTQARFAVPPGWGGLTRLVELVGASRAKAWLGTSAVVSSDDALTAGLANWRAEPGEFESELAQVSDRLTRPNLDLIRTLKTGVERATVVPRNDAIDAELGPFARHWGSDAHHERVARFIERSSS